MQVREQLMTATAELMRRHGVAGTGIAQILDASGVARRSIYLNFPGGKAELVAEATRAAGADATELLTALAAEPDLVGALTGLWSERLQATDFDGGCPVLAAACSRDEAPEAADAAGAVFDRWATVIAARLQSDGIAPEPAGTLAVTIVAAVEGAVVLCRATRSTAPLDQVATHLRNLVAGYVPPGWR